MTEPDVPDVPEAEPAVEIASNPRRESRSTPTAVLVVIALLALAGVVLGAVALSRSGAQAGHESFSDQQRADAKVKACKAFDLVRRGVSRNTQLNPPNDVAGILAVAANIRIAESSGGQYLLARIDPATPDDLAEAMRGFANDLLDIGAAQTAGALNSDPDQATRLRNVEESNTKLGKMCG